MSTQREILIRNRHPRLRIDTRAIRRVIALLDLHFRYTAADLPKVTPLARKRSQDPAASAVPPGELSIVLFDDKALALLHGEFLDDPTTTDVITFEGFAEAGSAGEICVSADTARRFSNAAGLDFSRELTLYLIHGWLHLAGYDDLEPSKKRRMRAAEKRALALVGDAIPQFSLKSARTPRPSARR
ncbi:MAG: rRNA maturation RNase YbeY [Opitutaceae bacterium]|nr:rRNA maturation RNase YbeY [Opitutaceae bacterium]